MKENSLLRALTTILTVAVGLVGAALWGETWYGKLGAAALVAVVVACTEWLFVYLPRRVRAVRRLLDPRWRWEGVWIQWVTEVWTADPRTSANLNRFAIFVVSHRSGDYTITGSAYDELGSNVATWDTTSPLAFSPDGASVSYEWRGRGKAPSRNANGDRTGLAKLTLVQGVDAGYGRVDHVAEDLALRFNLQRLTHDRLQELGVRAASADTAAAADPQRRDALARRMAASSAFQAELDAAYASA